MKIYSYTSLLVLLLCFLNTVQAQNAPVSETNGKSVKLVQYMIRKGDYVIAIAKRFHVPVKEIIKINHFKGKDKVIYPGRKLWIPVAIKEKVWSPETATTFNSFLTKEDARPREDFEVDMDSLDDEIKEDFVTTSDMEADSIQRNKIANHIQRIENQIKYLQYRLDSIKNADLSFQFDENDKNSILHKMKLARDRYYSTGPIGLQIDSLNALKAHLGEENGRIKARLSEYEYLQENTDYFRRKKEGLKSSYTIMSEPGSQIANESSYLSSGLTLKKNKKEENRKEEEKKQPLATEKSQEQEAQNTATNSSDKSSQPAEEASKPEQSNATTQEKGNTNSSVEAKNENKNATDVSTKERTNAVIESMPNSAASNELKTNDEKKLGVNNNFIRSQGNKPYVAPPSSNAVKTDVRSPEKGVSSETALNPKTEASKTASDIKKEETTISNREVNTTAKGVKDASSKEAVKPKVESNKASANVNVDTKGSVNKDANSNSKERKETVVPVQNTNPKPKQVDELDADPTVYHALDTISSLKNKNASNSIYTDTSRFYLSNQIDSTVLKPKPEKVNDDPLATYKTDSNFIMKTVVIKDITFTDYRNRPKYLTPVDSIRRIKSEFYLILARKALSKPDFKEGEKLLRKCLELNPNYAQAWMLHADLYAATGYPEKALKEYTISSEIDTTNPKVFYNMALLFGRANNTDKAYQCYSRALEINDKYLLAYLGRAALLIEQRDYSGAIDDYDKVTAINKYYSLAYKGRGLAKMEAHNFEGAVLDFNQYLEIEDPDGYILYQRGISKVLSNQLLQGCLDFSSSFELGFKQSEKAIKKFCQ